MPLNFQQFNSDQLHEAFSRVQDETHWKNPIDSNCKVEEIELMRSAIRYFTGTEADFGQPINGVVTVRAIGYRNGPCGDH
jgi:hypothetical protein